MKKDAMDASGQPGQLPEAWVGKRTQARCSSGQLLPLDKQELAPVGPGQQGLQEEFGLHCPITARNVNCKFHFPAQGHIRVPEDTENETD